MQSFACASIAQYRRIHGVYSSCTVGACSNFLWDPLGFISVAVHADTHQNTQRKMKYLGKHLAVFTYSS